MYSLQEAARRCKMEFASRPEDKKPRWVITDAAEGPKLIADSSPTADQHEEGPSCTNDARRSHDYSQLSYSVPILKCNAKTCV